MSEYIPVTLRNFIRERAAFRCEYCRLPEAEAYFPFEPDHTFRSNIKAQPLSQTWPAVVLNAIASRGRTFLQLIRKQVRSPGSFTLVAISGTSISKGATASSFRKLRSVE